MKKLEGDPARMFQVPGLEDGPVWAFSQHGPEFVVGYFLRFHVKTLYSCLAWLYLVLQRPVGLVKQ